MAVSLSSGEGDLIGRSVLAGGTLVWIGVSGWDRGPVCVVITRGRDDLSDWERGPVCVGITRGRDDLSDWGFV